MKVSLKTVLVLSLTVTFSIGLTLAVTNPKILLGKFDGAVIATEQGKINSNNSANTDFSTHTTTINNNIINVNNDGFAVSGPPVILSGIAQSEIQKLTENEMKKIGKKKRLYKGKGESYANGSFTFGVNKLMEVNDIDYAEVSIYQLQPANFKVRTGWTQDFITAYGTFRLAVERIGNNYVEVAVYHIIN